MAQLHLVVSDEVAARVRERAERLGLSVSRYLALLVQEDVDAEWDAEFFREVAGGWQGELERPGSAPGESSGRTIC